MNYNIEPQIKKLLRHDIHADEYAIQMTLHNNNNKITPELEERIKLVKTMKEAVQAFYSLLSENELIVVQRHYVARVDWDCLSVEFAQKWGEYNAKSKRSMIGYLNKAFKKMTQYVIDNEAVFDFSWLNQL